VEFVTSIFANNKLAIVAKNDDGEKLIQIEEDPKFSFYINNIENFVPSNHHDVPYIEFDKVNKISTKYSKLFETIAKELDSREKEKGISKDSKYENFYRSVGRSSMVKQLHKNPNIHASDMNVEDYYKAKFNKIHFKEGISNISKAYLDIEVDTFKEGRFVSE